MSRAHSGAGRGDEAVLSEALDLLPMLEWASFQTDGTPPELRFADPHGPDVRLPHSEVLAISSDVAEHRLFPAVRAAGEYDVAVVVAAASTLVQVVAFLAALRAGAAPLVVPAGSLTGLETGPLSGWLDEYTNRTPQAVVVLTDEVVAAARPEPSEPYLHVVLPSAPSAYESRRPGWYHPNVVNRSVDWLQLDDEPSSADGCGVSARRGHDALVLADGISARLGSEHPGPLATRIPLHREWGLAAALLWPILTGRSAVVQPPERTGEQSSGEPELLFGPDGPFVRPAADGGHTHLVNRGSA